MINDHVPDEVTEAGSAGDSDMVLWCLKLPPGDINGDAALPLQPELVHDPCVLE